MSAEQKKTETFIYKGLGIPVKLVNAPMKKAAGVWCIDINMNLLLRIVLEELLRKPTALKGNELRYLRKTLDLTPAQFSKIFGTTQTAISKWEDGRSKISPQLEFYIRLFILNHLRVKDAEFRAFYNLLNLSQLSKRPKGKTPPLVIDATAGNLKIGQQEGSLRGGAP